MSWGVADKSECQCLSAASCWKSFYNLIPCQLHGPLVHFCSDQHWWWSLPSLAPLWITSQTVWRNLEWNLWQAGDMLPSLLTAMCALESANLSSELMWSLFRTESIQQMHIWHSCPAVSCEMSCISSVGFAMVINYFQWWCSHFRFLFIIQVRYNKVVILLGQKMPQSLPRDPLWNTLILFIWLVSLQLYVGMNLTLLLYRWMFVFRLCCF